ncbi:MAG TPA: PEGA domain-containing protein [Gemmatimonadales bacterium]|nr:PEGA domain-containing protein [Gemmatimonadales bacterium]
MRLHRWFGQLALAGSLALVAGCATIMHGSTQEVAIGSAPTGARVIVDGVAAGVTPYVADLKRKDKHVIRIEMDGYEPFEMPISRATSGWVWGNLVFGGLPGLAVDAITGGLYKLKPEEISASLREQGVSVADGADYLVVAVVLKPQAGWERIGELSAE